jgi:glyoxylase-like metal-dependent hydrolase (beta-lactamase superfamily II)
MVVEQHSIGKRGKLFIFDDLEGCLTHVYTLIGVHYVFIIDTYLGESYIKSVLEYLKDFQKTRMTVIINSHYDWDHIWGNSAFPHGLLITHDNFPTQLKLHFEDQLKANQKYVQDNITIPKPNITFSSRMTFIGEGIEIFHSPGHTSDSISIYDTEDKVLIVGDNVEEPEPYENDVSREVFVNTLESYLKYPFKYLIAGHYWAKDDSMIRENIKNLKTKI